MRAVIHMDCTVGPIQGHLISGNLLRLSLTDDSLLIGGVVFSKCTCNGDMFRK